jgi:class 3 adenylate cyclase
MALISFIKIISGIKKSRKLLRYKENPLLNERIPNYSVKMGFGLHVGWAIEGAIGSFYKIDASYLSPHVNMASRLEAATKQFGV